MFQSCAWSSRIVTVPPIRRLCSSSSRGILARSHDHVQRDDPQQRPWRLQSRTLATSLVPLRKQLKDEAKASRGSKSKSDDKLKSSTHDGPWELTVGIEIHAQLNTAAKLFSVAPTSFNATPNFNVEPFDVALPGAQPQFQIATLLPALRAALALECTIQPMSRFDRKHYFYHDQPAGYQITQYYEPFARNGVIELGLGDGVRESQDVVIKQVQMEQDTAKSQEQDEDTNLVDFNRAGHPLIEIISMPDIHSSEAASAYVKKIQTILLSVDAVTAGMEQGGLRADVNVSVRRRDAPLGVHSYNGVVGLGQRTEIKNLSTIKAVGDAVRAEQSRQISVLEKGGRIEGETRGWSLARPGETRRLRGKEGEVDYRYMPDPDVPPLYIGQTLVEQVRATLPTLPDALVSILTDNTQYGLSATDAKILLSSDTGDRLDFFQETVERLQQLQEDRSPMLTRTVGNWILHEIGHVLTTRNIDWEQSHLTSESLAILLNQLLVGEITNASAKHILVLLIEGDTRRVEQIVSDKDFRLTPMSREEYLALAKGIVAAHASTVRQIQDKKQMGKLMFLVGQMMREGPEGRVEPEKAEEMLRDLIFDN